MVGTIVVEGILRLVGEVGVLAIVVVVAVDRAGIADAGDGGVGAPVHHGHEGRGVSKRRAELDGRHVVTVLGDEVRFLTGHPHPLRRGLQVLHIALDAVRAQRCVVLRNGLVLAGIDAH